MSGSVLKIGIYSFEKKNIIGSGYESEVYKGKNDLTGTFFLIQINLSPSK